MNRNSKRKAKAAAKVLAHRKQSDPNYVCYPPPPKRRKCWQGHKVGNNRKPEMTAWPKIA